jgi:hypothetical protein
MPLDLLIDQIEPKACLIKFPKRLWIFGGELDLVKPAKSLRDSFWKQSLQKTLPQKWIADFDCPEQHKHWWAFSGYDDLLMFERDACYLARGTILFAESPGSLAELGALAIDGAILPRLMVVVQSRYLNEDSRKSFLYLGPLKRVEDQNGLCVIGSSSDTVLTDNDFDEIIRAIDDWLPTTHKTSVFNIQNPTHRLLLLADLVDLLLVSNLKELQRAIGFFDVKLTDEDLVRALALLDFFGFIKKEMSGREPFWVSLARSDAPWIDYTGKPSHSFERSRFKLACNDLISKDVRKKALFQRSR